MLNSHTYYLYILRYMGTITGIGDLDPARWPNSHWRSVKVNHLNSLIYTSFSVVVFCVYRLLVIMRVVIYSFAYMMLTH